MDAPADLCVNCVFGSRACWACHNRIRDEWKARAEKAEAEVARLRDLSFDGAECFTLGDVRRVLDKSQAMAKRAHDLTVKHDRYSKATNFEWISPDGREWCIQKWGRQNQPGSPELWNVVIGIKLFKHGVTLDEAWAIVDAEEKKRTA